MWDPQTTKPSYINPGLFWTTVKEGVIGTVYESFAHPIPHDAFEFITYILDQCHETMKKPLAALIEKYCVEPFNINSFAEYIGELTIVKLLSVPLKSTQVVPVPE
jgi:hypothetical protein